MALMQHFLHFFALSLCLLKNAVGFYQNFNFASPSRHETALASSSSHPPTPIDASGWPEKFPAKEHCSKCGLCETSLVTHVTDACAFIGDGMARIDKLEERVHGRRRDVDSTVWSDSSKEATSVAEEGRFGVMNQPMMLARGVGIPNAQWTGCVTAIALSMLDSGMVDAVVCIANESDGDWSSPEPIIAKTADDVLRGRGVKPALAPSLRVLDELKRDESIRKLLFCGVGCAVQAFRAVQHELDLDQVYVLGTNCADNSPTPQAAKNFVQNGVKVDNSAVTGYEFMQDFRVHVKTKSSYVTKPYFTLPGVIAKESIAPSCLACFDYTNALADVVVGYMGAPLEANARMDESFQTLTVRNERGAQMVETAIAASRLALYDTARGQGLHEKLASATVASDGLVQAMVGGTVREEGMPLWMGEIMASVMTFVGPKGVTFARYSIDYHTLRNYLHVLDVWGETRARTSIPQYALDIVDRYLEHDKPFAELKDKIVSKK